MSVNPKTPEGLVEELKKSGEFERLSQQLLEDFEKDECFTRFKESIEEIGRQQLLKAQMLHYLPQEMVHRELMREVERYPIVERIVSDSPVLANPSLLSAIQDSLVDILRKRSETGNAPGEVSQRSERELSNSAASAPGHTENIAPDEGRKSPNSQSHGLGVVRSPGDATADRVVVPVTNAQPAQTTNSPPSSPREQEADDNEDMDVDDD